MNIIFDLDSTLATIEGIDELARIKGVGDRIVAMTNDAMAGKLPLDQVFKKRLEIINPTPKDLQQIANLYLQNLTLHIKHTIKALQTPQNKLFIVTGGYYECAYPVAKYLGIKNLYANKLLFKGDKYLGLDEEIPLWKNGGKGEVVNLIKDKYPGYTVMIGDGYSDYEAGADKFICYAGVVERPEVTNLADEVIYDIRDLKDLLLPRELTINELVFAFV